MSYRPCKSTHCVDLPSEPPDTAGTHGRGLSLFFINFTEEVIMKLAEALALRKELSDRFKKLVGNLQFSGPIVQQITVRVKLTEAASDKIKVETKLVPTMALLAERHYICSRIARLDNIIHTVNTGNVLPIPLSVGYEFLAVGHVQATKNITVDQCLGLRAFTEQMVINLQALASAYIDQPQAQSTVITAQPESLNQVVTKLSTWDPNEMRRVANFFSHQLRVLDTAIQQFNWTTEVQVPADIAQAFDPAPYLNPLAPAVAPGAGEVPDLIHYGS